MRLSIDTNELNAGISTVVRALSSRTTVSILEGIYMEASEHQLLLKCTDLSLQIEAILPAMVDEEGAIVLPGRLFAEMARKLPGEDASIEVDKSTAMLTSGRWKNKLQGESASEFHNMNTVNREYAVSISPTAFKSMIRQTIFAAAQDETKLVLTGALLEMCEGTLSIVALDGYRLALRREGVEGLADERTAIIPARSLLEISRILPDANEPIDIVFSRTHVLIDLGHTRITARLLDGEFIKYKQILPDTYLTRVRANRAELMDCIERAALTAREGKNNIVRFLFKDDVLCVSANSEVSTSNEELSVSMMGSEIAIAFNARYFTDVLKSLDDVEVYLDMNNNISPCVVRPVQGDAFYYLILPVRLGV